MSIRDLDHLMDLLGVNDPDYKPPIVWLRDGVTWVRQPPIDTDRAVRTTE